MSDTEQLSVPKPKAGALRSALNVALNTHYAIGLWQGRATERLNKENKENKEHDEASTSARQRGLIVSMPGFIHKTGRINQDSLKDNPYADQKMLELETLIMSATAKMQDDLAELKQTMAILPAQVTISDINCSSPLNIGVYSETPLGYRCVWLLVGFDQLVMQAFQAFHYGFISRQQRDRSLKRGGHLLRQIYGVAQKYRWVPVSRRDIAAQNEQAVAAMHRLGAVDDAVLLGTKRSSFSPPLNKESVALLQAARQDNG